MVTMTCCGSRFDTVRDSMNHECPTKSVEVSFLVFPTFQVLDGAGKVIATGDQLKGFLHVWGPKNTTAAVYRNADDLKTQIGAHGIVTGYDARIKR